MVSQLEVCQPLSSGSQFVYPVGLNGCETLMITSQPKSLARGTNLLGGKPIYLKVGIPQSMAEGPELKPPPSGVCPSILMASSIKATPPKVEREVSMTMEVREFLSQAVLYIIWTCISELNLKETKSHGHNHTSTPQTGSSFWSTGHIIPCECPGWCWEGGASLEEILTAPSPTAEAPGPSNSTPPKDTGHLWEEANKALGELLATKKSINAHQQKLVWELGMALCQNEFNTTESIKEAKATCTHSIQEVKTLCFMAIRDTEAWGASQASSLEQPHAKSIQCLEEQAIEEESKSQLDFFSTFETALWASPVELHGMLVASYQVLMGQSPMPLHFSLSQGASSSEQVPAAMALLPPAPEPLPRPKWQHPSPDLVDVSPPGVTTSQAFLVGFPSSKHQEVMPLYKVLTPSYLEAFNWDSSLVREMREEYFKRHCSNISTENTHDLSEVFWHMIITTELLGSSIYEIKET